MQTPTRAAVTTAALVGVLAAAGTGPASAGVSGVGTGAHGVSSGSFAVVPTTSTGRPAPGALTLSWDAVLNPAPQYLWAYNTGTLSLIGTSYSVVVTGGLLEDPAVTLTACVNGTWDRAAGTCSGTASTIGTWKTGSAAAVAVTDAVPAAPDSRVEIRATLSSVTTLTAVVTAEITTSVTSGATRQVRTATTTGS